MKNEEKSWPLQTPEELTKEFEFEQEDKQEDPSRTNPETQLKHPVDVPFWHVAHDPSQPLELLPFIWIHLNWFEMGKRKRKEEKDEILEQIPELLNDFVGHDSTQYPSLKIFVELHDVQFEFIDPVQLWQLESHAIMVFLFFVFFSFFFFSWDGEIENQRLKRRKVEWT